MRPSKRLVKLHRAARSRLARIRSIAIWHQSDKFLYETEARLAFVTIECLNIWANFVRSYYLSCMYSTVTVGRVHVSAALGGIDENHAIGLAVKYWRHRAQPKADGSWHRREEPAWHDPNLLIPICRWANFTNIADIEAAFSTGDRTFLDLPVFRNYFAHRSIQTAKAAQSLAIRYGIPGSKQPSEILRYRPLGRPQPLILEWIDHILFTIEFLCA